MFYANGNNILSQFLRLWSIYGIYDGSGFIEIYMAEKASQSGANSVESYENQ